MNELIGKFLFRTIQFVQHHYISFQDRMQTKNLSHKLKKCGKGTRIRYPCDIRGFQQMEVGHNVHINRGALIRAQGGLKIEDNVHIARNVTIYTINHDYLGNALPYDETSIRQPVIVERNVWVGVNVTIIPGVRIGEGAIIGAGVVVSRNVPPLAIVGSQPYRVLKYRDKTRYEELDKMKKYGGANGKALERIINDDD